MKGHLQRESDRKSPGRSGNGSEHNDISNLFGNQHLSRFENKSAKGEILGGIKNRYFA